MPDKKVVVKVDNITKKFRIPLEASSGIKQKLINILKGRKGYRVFTPLKNISFEVHEGDFFGIVGRNGSGKSTLLKTIAGIYTPNGGAVHVNGKLVPFIELGVGFNPELTGRENIFLNGALLGFSHKEMEAMYDEIVDFAELGDFMEERLKNYSSGMQVRLAFSIAIKAKGDVLILDEVLAVGDAAFQQKCYSYFEDLKKNNKTVILVTHDMDSVRRFCTKAIYIENGIITKLGNPVDIADYYAEANIQNVNDDEDIKRLDNKYKLIAKIHSQTDNEIIIDFEYDIKDETEAYIATSVIWMGISVAEISTPTSNVLKGSGKMTYTLDTKIFNSGVYQFTASLFGLNSRELLTISKTCNIFTIHGEDKTKGGAIKLADRWKYEK